MSLWRGRELASHLCKLQMSPIALRFISSFRPLSTVGSASTAAPAVPAAPLIGPRHAVHATRPLESLPSASCALWFVKRSYLTSFSANLVPLAEQPVQRRPGSTSSHCCSCWLESNNARFHTSRHTADVRTANEGYANATIPYKEIAQSLQKVYQNVGPFGILDLIFGLKLLAEKHERDKEVEHVQGEAVNDRQQVLALIEDLDLAHAAYKQSVQLLCAHSKLKLQNILKRQPLASGLRPAYYVAVDHSQQVMHATLGTG